MKALYTLGELGRAWGISRWRVERMLVAAGVEFTMVGTRRHVSLAEVEDKLPDVWRSVFLAGDARELGH